MSRLPSIVAVHDRAGLSPDLVRQLNTRYRARPVHLTRLRAAAIGSADLVVVDVDLDDEDTIATVKSEILGRRDSHQPVIVLTTATQQRRLADPTFGARARLAIRPLDTNRFTESVDYLLAENRNWRDVERAVRQERLALLAPEHREALVAGDAALDSIFAFARGEAPLSAAEVRAHGETITSSLADEKLSRWISAVREHHDGTYQHCMLVTGVAVAFGQILRIPKKDVHRLTLATLLHDVGKANVSAGILDKPGPLTDDEMKIMRQHPVTGADLIAKTPDIDPVIVDVVRHHHEYLDGTGYPDGLKGSEISDLIRLTTIADVFSALVEKRSYKPTMSGLAAHEILVGMGPKLDQPLVRVMRAITKDF